jgi:RNA polymerase sigma-70 factor (ECF subfamily)
MQNGANHQALVSISDRNAPATNFHKKKFRDGVLSVSQQSKNRRPHRVTDVQVASEPNRPLNWPLICQQIAAGDAQALEILYEQYFDRVFDFARQWTGLQEADCCDIAQDTFLKIVRCVGPIADQSHLDFWMVSVARSVTYDHLRKCARRRAVYKQFSRDSRQRSEDVNASSEAVEIVARIQWVEQQLKQLPPADQKLISLRYRLGWKLSDIGKKLGIKPGTVDGRIRRALARIQRETRSSTND